MDLWTLSLSRKELVVLAAGQSDSRLSLIVGGYTTSAFHLHVLCLAKA